MKTTPVLATLTITLALTAAATTTRAANLLWGAPTTISADTDVLNTGIAVVAVRLGTTGLTPATVNGVTFAPVALTEGTTSFNATAFSLTFQTGSFSGSNTGYGSTAAPYSNLPAATRNLLQSGVGDGNGSGIITLTLNGLVIGQDYTFEWWANNAGNATGLAGQRERATGGTGSVTLNNNSYATGTTGFTSRLGGVGQFAVGTFTADTSSQVITFQNITQQQDFTELNALQLRTVPEPSTYALALLGGLGLFGVARRHRAARLRV